MVFAGGVLLLLETLVAETSAVLPGDQVEVVVDAQ